MMDMTWNWKINPEIIFQGLQPQTPLQLAVAVAGVFALAVATEGARAWQHAVASYAAAVAQTSAEQRRRSLPLPREDSEADVRRPASPSLRRILADARPAERARSSTGTLEVRATLLLVLYAAMQTLGMLVLMTYNGYLILATLAGRGTGYWLLRGWTQTAYSGIASDDGCC